MAKATIYLFSSPTCPHCPPAKAFAEDYVKSRDDVSLIQLNTATHEGQRKAASFNIMSVPTFIIKGDNYPENIGLKGIQSKKTMDKYVDIATGKKDLKKEQSKRSTREKKIFKVGPFKFKF